MQRPHTSIDLSWLTGRLHTLFASDPPVGAIVGRTKLRDAVMIELQCSELEAEQLVDTLVLQRRVQFQAGDQEPGYWRFDTSGTDPRV